MSKYDENRCPITPDDIRSKRDSISVGSTINLPIMQYDDGGFIEGYRMEQCTVITKSRHLIVLRRPDPRMLPISRTYAELCLLDRGVA